MSLQVRSAALALCCLIACFAAAPPVQEKKPYAGACTAPVDDYFVKEVWANVGSARCINCHKKGGDAEDSKLILRDPRKLSVHDQDEALRHNREAFVRMARLKEKDQSRLLVKVTGGLDHGGGEVLKADGKGYAVLAEFVRRLNAPKTVARPIDDSRLPPFFAGVVMLDPKPLLRRVTLSLAGRLPTEAEKAAVAAKGMDALPPLLDALMKEEAFYDRIREGFNDIFLTLGVDGGEA